MVKLMKNGNVTNKYKGFMDGKSVYALPGKVGQEPIP